MNRQIRKREQGFTLIEIIAVLIILGILAAVAVPKFINMQDEAKEKAFEGACAAVASQFAMTLSEQLLANNGDEGAAFTAMNASEVWDLGDFNATGPGSYSTNEQEFTFEITGEDSSETYDCKVPNPAWDGTTS